MTETLESRRADARQRMEEAEQRIPAALLDGGKKGELERLRRQRDEALRDARELEAAGNLAAERAKLAEDEAGAERRRERAAEAARISIDRHKAAAEVDRAMAALEAAVRRHDELGAGLACLIDADAGARIGRSASQSLRWAMWHGAPRAAELLGVPFANGRRRRPLAELCPPLRTGDD